MKIVAASLDVMEFDIPRLEINDARKAMGGRITGGLLRLRTDDGTEGNAHLGDRGGGDARTIADFWDWFGGALVGSDTERREPYWENLEGKGLDGGITDAQWAHVDVALWDAAGKATGKPVHQMLGTKRETCKVYATYPPRNSTIAGYIEEANEVAEAGFTAYKIHPGAMPVKQVVEMVHEVRRAVGDDFDLMLDPNHGYDFGAALEIGCALDANSFTWFEDPVPWSHQSEIEELSASLSTPLAMSDSADFLITEATESLERGWPEIIRGTTRKIGITGLKRQCEAAARFGRQCEVGTAGNSLMNAANLNVIMAVQNCWYYEYWMPLEAQWFGMSPEITVNLDGELEAPTLPGLGFEIDEDFVSRHRVSTLSAG